MAVALLIGCGANGNPAASREKERDAEIINIAIGQDMTLARAYGRARAFVEDPRRRAILRRYLAQEQEHIDGWTQAIRGLGGQVETEPEAPDYSEVESEGEYLRFIYELTGSQLTHFLDDVPQFSTPAPQSFAASIAANEAQHLVVLRQLLGSDLLEAVPDSFDTGEIPPPEPGRGAAPPGGKG